MNIDGDSAQRRTMTALTRLGAHHGVLLGVGEPLDELLDAVIRLATCESAASFRATFKAAHVALHKHWTRTVGTVGYRKALWSEVEGGLLALAMETRDRVGLKGDMFDWVLRGGQ